MELELEKRITELENSISRYKGFAFFIIGISTIAFIIFWCLLFTAKGTEYDYFKDLGSISGGIVSSLFSLSGLILVYVAFLGQKQQLLYQQIELLHNKEELKLNREELQNQRIEMQQQNETLKLQNFENTYFNLISNYQKNVSINYVTEKNNWFRNYIRNFNIIYQDINNKGGDIYGEVFWRLENNYPNFKDHSFVYQINSIISIINNAEIFNKTYYINTLWGLLSQNEKDCLYVIVNYYPYLEEGIKETFIKSNIFEGYNYLL